MRSLVRVVAAVAIVLAAATLAKLKTCCSPSRSA